MEAQVRVDELILLTIKRMGINGEGIGYYKRQAIFVPNSIVGEIVEVKITEVRDGYAYGEVTKFKKVSPYRIEPKCPYYGRCGGCQLQHIDYEEQLNQKRLIVEEAFDRYFDGDSSNVIINNTIGMSEPWYYRNKTQLPVRHDGEKVVTGMYAKDSNRLVFIDECLIEEKLVSNTMHEILSFLTKANIDVYNPKFRQGSLRYIVLRGFADTKELQATFVLIKEDKRLINILKDIIKIKNIKSVFYTINSDPKSIEIISGKVNLICGEEKIKGKLGKLDFQISPNSFFQLNSKQTIKLYDTIKEVASLTGNENVIDLYCGIGSIGLYLADNAKKVYGVDNNSANIVNAKEFARINNIKNAEFYCGSILPNLEKFSKDGFKADVLIVDPPRRGIELQILNYLQKSKIKKIIYVSCNPSTLAKNLNHLQRNYEITFIQPFDMFPNTSNIECVCLLTLKK